MKSNGTYQAIEKKSFNKNYGHMRIEENNNSSQKMLGADSIHWVENHQRSSPIKIKQQMKWKTNQTIKVTKKYKLRNRIISRWALENTKSELVDIYIFYILYDFISQWL